MKIPSKNEKMCRLISMVFHLIIAADSFNNYPDYKYDYEEYDYDLCSNPDEAHVTTGSCSHDAFFNSSVVELIKDMKRFQKTETRICCNEHEYVFKDYCEERETNDKYVCAPKDFSSFAGRQDPLLCPQSCRQYRQIALGDLKKYNLAYRQNKIVINNESLHSNIKHFRIHDSCLSYACKPGSAWTVGIELCVCHDAGPRKELDVKTFSEKHDRCCKDYEIMKFDETQRTMRCVSSKTGYENKKSSQSCQVPFKKVNIFGSGMEDNQHYRRGKLIENGTYLTIHFKKYIDERKHSIKDLLLPRNFKNYCVGWELNRDSRNYGLELSFGPFLPSLVYCKPKLVQFNLQNRLKRHSEKGHELNLARAKLACEKFGIGWNVTRKTNHSLVCSKVSSLLNCHNCGTWRLLVWRDGACDKLVSSKCNPNMTKAGHYYCGYDPCAKYGNLRYGGKWRIIP